MSSKRRKMSPNKVNRQRGMHGAIASTEIEIIRRVAITDDPLNEELLRGIPNHVTLTYIAAKVPWRDWQVLIALSRDWQAFQGRMVYDARVSSQTTETFFVLLCRVSTVIQKHRRHFHTIIPNRFAVLDKWTLSLLTTRGPCRVPPVPGCRSGLPYDCQFVVLNGSMYLLGGTRSGKKYIPSAEVHVLDFARHPLEWRRCANMQISRRQLTVGVMHGKIFVFGGESEGRAYEVRNEVYDPKVDAWSWIAPMIPSASVTKVYAVGQKFFVCRGWISRFRAEMTSRRDPVSDDDADILRDTKLVVKVGASGPELISTSDDDVQDDINGLHGVIKGKLGEILQSRPLAKCLACEIRFSKKRRPESFLGVYDPVKDEWRKFEKLSLETDNVDIVHPRFILKLGESLRLYSDICPHPTALFWMVTL